MTGVSQISLPIRILLIGAVVFLAAWFTILRPKRETVAAGDDEHDHHLDGARRRRPASARPSTPPRRPPASTTEATATATPATGYRDHAAPDAKPEAAAGRGDPGRGARQASQGRRRRAEGAQGARARRVRRGRQAVAPAGRRRPLRPQRPASEANRYDGDVVRQARRRSPSSRPTARWSTTSASTSPRPSSSSTATSRARVLTGYVDRIAINQVIADARRDSITPNITDAYLRKANDDLRRTSNLRVERWSCPTIRGKQGDRSPRSKRAAGDRRQLPPPGRRASPRRPSGAALQHRRGSR